MMPNMCKTKGHAKVYATEKVACFRQHCGPLAALDIDFSGHLWIVHFKEYQKKCGLTVKSDSGGSVAGAVPVGKAEDGNE